MHNFPSQAYCVYFLAFGNTLPANYSAFLALENDGKFVFSKKNCIIVLLLTKTLEEVSKRVYNVVREFLELLGKEDILLSVIWLEDENDMKAIAEQVFAELENLSKQYMISEIIVNITSSAKSILAATILAVTEFILANPKAASGTKLRICYVGSRIRESSRGAAKMMLGTYWKELRLPGNHGSS